MFSLSLDCWGRLLAAAQIPVLGSHSSAWITLQCSDSIPVLGSLSSAWLVSSARIRIHSVSVSSTRISFSAVFNPEVLNLTNRIVNFFPPNQYVR
ncbi:hypothetical protein Anas_14142 [Armadillidium nasatum]|uniref:Uncharacterized protein n=1 Tax=Armadillidium nasatum TaxID=96803 RepID=A0A5N5TEK9_9CRUS|nr:hypothetical protein Anas_14142 [Armadillidium nasatum]